MHGNGVMRDIIIGVKKKSNHYHVIPCPTMDLQMGAACHNSKLWGSPAGQGQEHDPGCAVWLAPRHSLCPLWLVRGEFGPFAATVVSIAPFTALGRTGSIWLPGTVTQLKSSQPGCDSQT